MKIVNAVPVKIGELELTEIHLGEKLAAVVTGKDGSGNEIKLWIPLTFAFRTDRRKEPTLEEIKDQVKKAVVEFCFKAAWNLDRSYVLTHAKGLKQLENLTKKLSEK